MGQRVSDWLIKRAGAYSGVAERPPVWERVFQPVSTPYSHLLVICYESCYYTQYSSSAIVGRGRDVVPRAVVELGSKF